MCLAGFMRLLDDDFVVRWRDRLVNIHPVAAAGLSAGSTRTRARWPPACASPAAPCISCAPAMDEGPIIVQAAVPVLPGDDAERLAARVLAAEHRAYPLALRLIAEGRVRVAGERAEIIGAAPAPTTVLNPSADA